MATRSANIPQYGVNSTALMRAAFQAFHDSLVAVGLVWESSCPGQLDIASLTYTGTSYNYYGNRVYRFNDALQATAPIHLFVYYYSGQTGDGTGFYIDAGELDLVNNKWKRFGIRVMNASGYTYGAASQNSLFSGDGSRIQIALWRTPGFAGALMSLERTKDINGADTAEGIIGHYNWTNNKYIVAGIFDSPTSGRSFSYPCAGCVVPQNGTGVYGSDIFVFPKHQYAPEPLYPGLGLFSYFDGNIAKGTPVQVQCQDGAMHTYWPLGNDDNLNQCHDNMTSPGTVYHLMRWE